ncbi:MAG: ArsR family transcriptional regulator [Thermoplasmata archaeon]|nr:ArsR family transcriptional regulator [Thermoplasmata archaeon]RLF26417.1 MAG: ArsR family transcriptional regulator [Thermoplasmata archaeon]
MSNENVFRALSSKTRIEMMKKLLGREIHLSELARQLKISVPVVSRHAKILENAGLVKRRVIGNVHLLSANTRGLNILLDSFAEETTVRIEKGESLFDAFKQLPGVEIKQIGNDKYVASIDGEDGYYIYEVNHTFPKIPIDKYRPEERVTVFLKKIISVNVKKVDVFPSD